MNFSVQPRFIFLQKFRSILLPFEVDQAKDYVLDLTKAMENDPASVVHVTKLTDIKINLINQNT
jgi:hypothetical protein